MGIRIHKNLGYGLIDLKYENCNLIDERINLESPLLTYENDECLQVKEYLKWLEGRPKRDLGNGIKMPDNYLDYSYLKNDRMGDKYIDLHDAFEYNGEYGLGNVLIIRTLSCTEWSRYGNIIDYVEESYYYGDSEVQNKVTSLIHPIHPFSSYMDDRTGERIKIRPMDLYVVKEWQKSGIEGLGDVQGLGFKDLDQAFNHCIPEVPQEIRDICEYANLFTDSDIWMQLRPILYVYWG